MKRKAPTPAEEQAKVDAWNTHRPIGTSVAVKMDDDSTCLTKTRSEAWLMGGHTAMICVDGISGGYMLERVRPV